MDGGLTAALAVTLLSNGMAACTQRATIL